MTQFTVSRAWETHSIDLASTDEVPQMQDWLLDDAATADEEAELAPDTIPSPPPESEAESTHVTIPAPPPVGGIVEE